MDMEQKMDFFGMGEEKVSDEWMSMEIKHRGKLHCIFGSQKHIWTAGKKHRPFLQTNVASWHAC